MDRVLLHGTGVEAVAAADHFSGAKNTELRCFDDSGGSIEGVPPIGRADVPAFIEGALYLRSPGVPPTNEIVLMGTGKAAMATTPTGYWLVEHAPAETITVTGTKGKSTTTALLAELLRSCGLSSTAYGNIGAPVLSSKLADERCPVVEVSSYMMHDLPSADHFHLITNLYKDHVHWHGTVDAYHRAKLKPFLRAGPAEGAAPRSVIARYGLPASCRAVEDLVSGQHDMLALDGHSVDLGPADQGFREGPRRSCLEAALAIARFLVRPSELAEAASTLTANYRGLPSRQYTVHSHDGRLWIDDALATVPEATLAALRRFEVRPTVLLLGGGDRGQLFGDLQAYCAARSDLTVIAFDPAGDRFAAADRRTEGFEEAIRLGADLCPEGGVLLFSPSAPSHPPFTSYKERAALFAKFASEA
jgi:UDP-N-acetylmuramoylalanine--D-glutamate ligase